MLKVVVVALVQLALIQGQGHRWDAGQGKWVPNDNPSPAVPAVVSPVVARPVGGNNPHEVAPSPNPGPFIHRNLHPTPLSHIPKVPIGQVEQRLRRIEVFLGLIDPQCTAPYQGPTKELRRMTYPSDPSKIYHSSDVKQQEKARQAGYNQGEVIGRLANEAFSAGCECLIPLYRRNFNNHVFRIEYRTKDTYPMRNDFLTARDFNSYDFQGDLKNWAIEGYCVPFRGACGANLQLSAFVPTKKLGDDRPLTLVTQDNDRVKWGNEKGFDETTLCYIWNP